MKRKLWVLAGLALGLAGCGDADKPVVDPIVHGLAIRTVDLAAETAACDAGEEVLGGFCYSKVGESLSASGIAFRMDSAGAVSASCLTGGKQIRLFCLKR